MEIVIESGVFRTPNDRIKRTIKINLIEKRVSDLEEEDEDEDYDDYGDEADEDNRGRWKTMEEVHDEDEDIPEDTTEGEELNPGEEWESISSGTSDTADNMEGFAIRQRKLSLAAEYIQIEQDEENAAKFRLEQEKFAEKHEKRLSGGLLKRLREQEFAAAFKRAQFRIDKEQRDFYAVETAESIRRSWGYTPTSPPRVEDIDNYVLAKIGLSSARQFWGSMPRSQRAVFVEDEAISSTNANYIRRTEEAISHVVFPNNKRDEEDMHWDLIEKERRERGRQD